MKGIIASAVVALVVIYTMAGNPGAAALMAALGILAGTIFYVSQEVDDDEEAGM